jgi:hypothetical protein
LPKISFLVLIYGFGAGATYIHLISVDAERGIRGFENWITPILADTVLAAIWPIYWVFSWLA